MSVSFCTSVHLTLKKKAKLTSWHYWFLYGEEDVCRWTFQSGLAATLLSYFLCYKRKTSRDSELSNESLKTGLCFLLLFHQLWCLPTGPSMEQVIQCVWKAAEQSTETELTLTGLNPASCTTKLCDSDSFLNLSVLQCPHLWSEGNNSPSFLVDSEQKLNWCLSST